MEGDNWRDTPKTTSRAPVADFLEGLVRKVAQASMLYCDGAAGQAAKIGRRAVTSMGGGASELVPPPTPS